METLFTSLHFSLNDTPDPPQSKSNKTTQWKWNKASYIIINDRINTLGNESSLLSNALPWFMYPTLHRGDNASWEKIQLIYAITCWRELRMAAVLAWTPRRPAASIAPVLWPRNKSCLSYSSCKCRAVKKSIIKIRHKFLVNGVCHQELKMLTHKTELVKLLWNIN